MPLCKSLWLIYFSSSCWLTPGVPLPALPSVQLWAGVSPCGTCPPSHGSRRGTWSPGAAAVGEAQKGLGRGLETPH